MSKKYANTQNPNKYEGISHAINIKREDSKK